MGVKDLWSILTPYAERKPICDLRGKIVAIDLAGWVCESLNVVDYFVHPQHHLKNLFFRTCYLIWEEVTPVFVLEGVAPKLKRQVIKKRNELQFRGVEPKKKSAKVNAKVQCDKAGNTSKNSDDRNVRTRFNWVLKQCERLLRVMGIECVQGPGEAEAYCAYLNQKGLVHGVVSQDSDCFAYGAVRVYRNFSISNQGAMAAQGGALDIYDMDIIRSKIDFGQNKVIAMALLCGCDYCPDGIGGVGRDSVLKLFNRYKDNEILQLLRRWRLETGKYAALELRLTDKNVCRNCGHMGRTQCHTKKGCDLCCTKQGCDNTLWKEERLALKAEVLLRQKAIANPTFPCEDIIQEFLSQPTTLPKLTLKWHQPDLIKFVKQIGELLQWTEIYCFQKFFPILTRWHVQNIQYIKQETSSNVIYVSPKEILKKRIVKGLPSLEIMWEDERHYFDNLIPEEQIQELNDIDSLWKTIEPLNLMQSAYPDLVATFLKSQEKPKKITRRKLITTTSATITKSKKSNVNSLENLNDLLAAAEDMENKLKSKKSRKCKKPLQKDSHLIEKYFQRRLKEHKKSSTYATSIEKHQILCSTPLNKDIKFAVEQESMNESDFDMSEIINNIVYKTEPIFNQLNNHEGQSLFYEILSQNVSELTKEPFLNDDLKCVDDLVLLKSKRSLSMSFRTAIQHPQTKRIALDDSFDVLVKMGNKNHSNVYDKFLTKDNLHKTILDHSKAQEYSHITSGNRDNLNQADVSYFFNNDYQDGDAFEKCMEISYVQHFENDYYVENDDLIVLSE